MKSIQRVLSADAEIAMERTICINGEGRSGEDVDVIIVGAEVAGAALANTLGKDLFWLTMLVSFKDTIVGLVYLIQGEIREDPQDVNIDKWTLKLYKLTLLGLPWLMKFDFGFCQFFDSACIDLLHCLLSFNFQPSVNRSQWFILDSRFSRLSSKLYSQWFIRDSRSEKQEHPEIREMQDYVPMVFDNFSAKAVVGESTVNLGLWDIGGDVAQHLCTLAELKFYFEGFFLGKTLLQGFLLLERPYLNDKFAWFTNLVMTEMS
ncbi:hypothetical protein L6452_06076 [Arctium lappa]|uniref:Uncharacterized protein n=1 Tax=Arctium lappa TaxID=4217 RepID=A0ACB9EIH1_ARCLA|nr:hypothetical protein L6452_06076 [Arctium lappa]